MSFITEVKSHKRPSTSQHTFSASANRQKKYKLVQSTFQKNAVSKSKSVHAKSRREKTNLQLQKSIDAIKGRSKAKQKWHKTVEMFHLFNEGFQKQKNSNINSCVTSPHSMSTHSLKRTPFELTTAKNNSKFYKSNSKPFFQKMAVDVDQFGFEPEVSKQQSKMQRINLFQCLLKIDLQRYKCRFNIPQTVLLDETRTFVVLKTDKDIIIRQNISKSDIFGVFQKGHQVSLHNVQSVTSKNVFEEMYQNLIDTKLNPLAPFVIICFENQKKNLSMQIQNSRNFGQNRWDSNKSSYVQRYVFSRNLKAMIMRVVYERCERGQQRQEYSVHRFQNYAGIFRNNTSGINDFLDFKAKVNPTYSRQYTLEYIKLTGPGVINRFIEPSSQIRKIIESVNGKRVRKLWIDFVEDVSGKIWVVGVKGVQFEEIKHVHKKSVWEVATQVGNCRLCNGVFQKSQLQNSVSVRMLLEFLHHLRRRTRIEDLDSLQFVNLLALNRKQNAMSAVCSCCYALIIRQLQLKKYERVLGQLCNIKIEDEGDPPKTEGKELFQSRLMVYLQEIQIQTKQILSQLSRKKIDNVTIRYVLAKGMEQKWKCKVEQKKMSVKRVKIHYLFSQVSKIEDFLKNSQILVSILSGQKEEVIAQGSTGILANFRNKFETENGQRQTTTVLLFFESGKYCALTLKVGLVHDGVYRVPEMPMRKVHEVMIPTKDYLNSNPLPKEWMQAFGYDQEIQLKEVKYEELMKETSNIHQKSATSGLKKKTMRHYW